VEAENLLVVYLSNGRRGPTGQSLAPYELGGAHVVDQAGQRVALFVNAHYRSHVLPWIASCLEPVEKIDNLRYAFSEYQSVVQHITRTYQSRVMSLEDFLLEASPEMDGRSRVGLAFEIAKEVLAVKAKWLEKMFYGLDDLLDEHVQNGGLVRITKENSPALQPLQFRGRHADLFFQRRVANKGRFWRIAAGPARDAAAIAVLFGKSALHIGLLPLQRSVPAHATLNQFDLRLDGQIFEFKRHGPINATFKGLVSWTVPLDEEIEHLAKLEGSRVARVVNAVVKRALESDALFRPVPETANESIPR
jgi:hypothetical protein